MRQILSDKKIGILGLGNMGRALARGLIDGKLVEPRQITASRRNKELLYKASRELSIQITGDNKLLARRSDVLILGVKPQGIMDALLEIRESLSSSLVISIAAGISTSFIEDALGQELAVVRVMPNTPSLVQQGVSGFCPGKYASDDDLEVASAILSGMGLAVKVSEDLLDPITAVSGTGPAYFFLLAEGLIKAAMELGITEELARLLVMETFSGASALMRERREPPARLREQVTSPGGTTEAAMDYLQERGFVRIFQDAVAHARVRAEELGQEAEDSASESQ